MSHAGGNRRIAFARSAFLHALAVVVLSWGVPAAAQTCVFNAGQPNVASFGSVDPSLSITGASDTGPGAYRLRNLAQPTQYMAYTVSTVIVPGTRIVLLGQLVAADYRDAYVGSYSDTLSVLILP